MSCSTSRMPHSRRSSSISTTRRCVSSGPTPAIGSSSSSRRGCVARAKPISSTRCSPWDSALASASAWGCKARRCNSASAASRSARSAATGRQKRRLLPLRACTASARLSRTVKVLNSRVIWKERARPRATRSWVDSAVTSAPSKRTRPASGRRCPDSCATRLVLPAPFGPIRAWISPGRTSRSTWSVATSAPKRLTRPCTCNRAGDVRASLMACRPCADAASAARPAPWAPAAPRPAAPSRRRTASGSCTRR